MTKGSEAQLGGASIKQMLASIFKSKTPKRKTTRRKTNKRKTPKRKTTKRTKKSYKGKKQSNMKGGMAPMTEAYNGVNGDFDYLPEGKDFGGKQPMWEPKTR
jgi:hypothetical protein